MRVATLGSTTRVCHNLKCTLTCILVIIAEARRCITNVVPNVNGTVRSVTHEAHAPQALQWDKTTTSSSSHEMFKTYTHREWEPRGSSPPKRSHTLMHLHQPSRLRVLAKACTPKTSRTHDTFDCPWCFRTATTGAHSSVSGHTELVR